MVLHVRHCITLVSHVPPQVEAEGDVATAFTLARILSNIPLSRGGPASVVIFDIHALQVLFHNQAVGLHCMLVHLLLAYTSQVPLLTSISPQRKALTTKGKT